MNATVTPIRHKNVDGKESQYIRIQTEKGKVLIVSGNSTLKKLEDIGIKEDTPADTAKKLGNAVGKQS